MTRASRIAALVLAAGASRRMGGTNKLLSTLDGATLIERAVGAAAGSRCAEVLVVTGWQADRVEAALQALRLSRPIRIVRNPDHAAGLAGSLRCALASLDASVDAALVLLGDMPWIEAAHIDRLIAAFDPRDPAIVVAVRNERRGHPVLWPRRHFASIAALTGDAGARELLTAHAGEVRAVPFDTDAIFEDVDTPDDLARARAAQGGQTGPKTAV
jgi:molybdenum cofactor cytidylyltransferase